MKVLDPIGNKLKTIGLAGLRHSFGRRKGMDVRLTGQNRCGYGFGCDQSSLKKHRDRHAIGRYKARIQYLDFDRFCAAQIDTWNGGFQYDGAQVVRVLCNFKGANPSARYRLEVGIRL